MEICKRTRRLGGVLTQTGDSTTDFGPYKTRGHLKAPLPEQGSNTSHHGGGVRHAMPEVTADEMIACGAKDTKG